MPLIYSFFHSEALVKGDPAVISELNAALSSELSAIAQYMVQAEMCANWGYQRLSALTKKRAIEEMHHAEHLIERILFLDGMPGVAVALQPKIGTSVQEHLQLDLADELDAVRQYNNSVEVCRKAGDAGTRELFEHMIQDEERHADFLESQLEVIRQIGISGYLTEQMKGE